MKNKWTKGGFSTGKKKTALVPCAVFLSCFGFDVFFFVSYWNRAFQNGYSSCVVEPDIELNDERSTPGWATIPLHHQLVAESARNEELQSFDCR